MIISEIRNHNLMKNFFSITIISILMACCFLIGLHLHGTFSLLVYQGRMTVKNFACYGHTNLWETYQIDCYKKKNQNFSFKMSNHLRCNSIILSGISDDNYSQDTKHYLNAMTIKMNNLSYIININSDKNILTRENTGGEVAHGSFTITQNDDTIISAYKKMYIGEPFYGYEHEQIAILKNTGKGVITHFSTGSNLNNFEGIGSTFVECQSE